MNTTEHRKNAEKAIAEAKTDGCPPNQRSALLLTAQINLLRSIDDNLTILVDKLTRSPASSGPYR
jgi:4-hydroxyphenylpyruvate dioxygenase-like putative hemolysin